MYLFLFLDNFFSLILQRCEDTLRGGRKGGEEKRGRERRKRGRERRKGGRRTRFQTIMVVKNECLLHTHRQTDSVVQKTVVMQVTRSLPSLQNGV